MVPFNSNLTDCRLNQSIIPFWQLIDKRTITDN